MKLLTENELDELYEMYSPWDEKVKLPSPNVLEAIAQAHLANKLVGVLKFYATLGQGIDDKGYPNIVNEQMEEDDWGGMAREALKEVE